MNRIRLKILFVLSLMLSIAACNPKGSYDCQYPPQTMRFCIIDSTRATPASWINTNNCDSLHLYAVKDDNLNAISFAVDSTGIVPIVISNAMSNLAARDDSTMRIREFRLYASKNLNTPYFTIVMDIRKSEDPNCVFYIYHSPTLNGRKMTLHTSHSYWVGAIQLD